MRYLYLLVYVRKIIKYGYYSIMDGFSFQGNKVYLLKQYFFYNIIKDSVKNINIINDNKLLINSYKHPYWNDYLFIKNNIPNYIWIENIQKRRLFNRGHHYDSINMGLLSNSGQLIDAYSHRFFRKIPISLSLMKPRYRYKFIYELYPYRLYKLYDHHLLIKNGFRTYNNILDTMSKIMKKYY